jgi:hypothetical protein
MKRILLIIGICLTVIIGGLFLAMRIWIRHDLKERIEIAKKQYPGKAEEALLAFLSDTANSAHDRSDVAIWTLGQIRSEKALPALYRLYKDDPEGVTCKGRHDSVLCQYEIHKAIVSIEHNWLGAKEKNWFGSWQGLNE